MGQRLAKQNITQFHHCVRNGSIDKVKEFLEIGINLEDQDEVFGTPLHESVVFDRYEVAELLIQNKADPNNPIKTPEKHSSGDTVLCVSSRRGRLNFVELFIKNGANVAQQGLGMATPLHCALENNHEDIAKLLIEHGAPVDAIDANGMTPLHVACKNLCRQSIELIMQRKPTTIDHHDKSCMTPIMYLAQSGEKDLMESLIRFGARTTYTVEKSTPLHVAKNTEIAQLLIANGADINMRDELLATPLHHACNRANDYELVAYLLLLKPEISAIDKANATPLHWACSGAALRNIEQLLREGANVNARDNKGYTPLHITSQLGYSGLSEVLMRHNADRNIANADGLTPVQLAMMVDD